MDNITTWTDLDGTVKSYRSIISNKDLLDAYADGVADILDFTPVKDQPRLMDVYVKAHGAPGGHLIRTSVRTAAILGYVPPVWVLTVSRVTKNTASVRIDHPSGPLFSELVIIAREFLARELASNPAYADSTLDPGTLQAKVNPHAQGVVYEGRHSGTTVQFRTAGLSPLPRAVQRASKSRTVHRSPKN